MGDIEDAIRRLKEFQLRVDVENVEKVNRACLYALRFAKMFCPVDEGNLRADISLFVSTDASEVRGRVYNTLFYAPYVHQGTGIYAKDGNGRKTPWVWKGDSVKWNGYHRTVGSHPKPYIEDAFLQNLASIEQILKG